VLLEAKERDRFLATDLEVGLRSRCAASIAKPGAWRFPPETVWIVKALPDTDIRIEEEKSGVKLAADRFDSRMQTLPLDDFPSLPEPSGAATATLSGKLLKAMVDKTQFAMTSEDTRYFLNGALLVLKADGMGLVATDGHRLALAWAKREPGTADAGEDMRVILPKKTVWELGRLLGETEGDVRYERGENHLFFEIGGRV
jgi:DNA polymerase-3 subunit beta